MRQTLLLMLSVFLLAGCSSDTGESPDAWRFGEGTDDPITVPEPDEPDREQPPPPDDPAPPTCVDPELELFFAVDRESTALVDDHVVVAGDRVFVSGHQEGHTDTDVLEWTGGELVAFDERPGTDDIPIDYANGVLWTIGPGFMRYDLGSTAEPFQLDLAGAARPEHYYYWAAQPRRFTNGDEFAWLNGTGMYVFTADEEVRQYPGAQPDLWVGDTGVAWFSLSDSRGGHAHFTDLTGADREVSDNAYVGWPVIVGESVLFVSTDGIMSWTPSTGVIEHVIEGRTCGPLHSDGTTAVTACREDALQPGPRGNHYLGIYATQVWTIDAQMQANRVYRSNQREVWMPMVNERWIVWLEHGPQTNSQQDPLGAVMVQPRAGDGEPVLAAHVLRGCFGCGAYWPPPVLDLDEDTVAFNYALRSDDPTTAPPWNERYGSIGVLRLNDCE